MSNTAPSFLPIQQESITFNQPTSEASMTAIAGLVNALRFIMLPVGSIVDSMLTEAQWHSEDQDSTRWIIADGRNVAGSAYQILTGNATVPDLTGRFRRGKGANNPDGDLALGTLSAAKFGTHTHGVVLNDPSHHHTVNGKPAGATTTTPPPFLIDNPYNAAGATFSYPTTGVPTGITIGIVNAGSNDTAPENITINSFIRVN